MSSSVRSPLRTSSRRGQPPSLRLVSEDRPEPTDAVRVWRLRSVEGEGWLRELTDEGPIITADRDEAEQFASAGDARTTLERYSKIRGRIAMKAVAGPASEKWRFGTP